MTKTALAFDDDEQFPPLGPLHKYGMSSQQLADAVASILMATQDRVMGVGNAQYSQPDGQKFERMTTQELITALDEEILDGIVYLVMFRIVGQRRLAMLREAIDKRVEDEVG